MDIGPPLRFWTAEPRLGFGAWALGGRAWGPAGAEQDRLAAVARALERGVTFFDTAPSYGDGASEALLGRALATDRLRLAIATKVGPRDDPQASLEGSLTRLRTDYVDLLQLHELGEQWEPQLEALARLRETGKVRAIGLCNATHQALTRALSLTSLASYQGLYNLVDRDVEERELPFCRERGLAFFATRPLASGLLSGKYAAPPAFGAGDHRRGLYWFQGREFARRHLVLERLAPWARSRRRPLATLALAWVLARPGVSVVLVGAKTAAQMDENLAATTRPLEPDEVAHIDRVVREVFPPARASARARALATSWGPRERHIVELLDGGTSPEAIAARWTDRGEQPMIAAQVKVFCDRLADEGLLE